MSGSGVQMTTGNTQNSAREVFALTDEQILGMEEEATGEQRPAYDETATAGRPATSEEGGEKLHTESAEDGAQRARRDGYRADADGKDAHAGVHFDAQGKPVAQEVPQWLAERMKDPWHGDQAKEFWEGKQNAEKEAAAYREVFATAEDARALKDIYPGGVSEAKSAAERARALDDIDGAFYRGDSAARAQLAQKMMEQDPAAFREMVEAGVRLLGKASSDQRSMASEEGGEKLHTEGTVNGTQRARRDGGEAEAQTGVSVSQEVARAYGEFERAANGELEKSVGGVIARTIKQALPNLRYTDTPGRAGARHAVPLQERLAGAVRDEIDAALKSDGQLGEQVAKILAGRRFDEGTRAQVVRLIDARAQQLVPGAVRRVVGSWTQATLSARRGNERETAATDVRVETRSTKQTTGRSEKSGEVRQESGRGRGRRVDYGKLSDEEILEL